MKTTTLLRRFLAIAGSAALAAPLANGANIYWDGTSADIIGNGTGVSGGGAGTWDLAIKNWDLGAVAHNVWVNANNDTAVFGGASAGTVTLGSSLAAPITVGGLRFDTTGYTIDASTNSKTLSFGATNNTILFNNIAAATINGTVGGSGNVVLSSTNSNTASTLFFAGASTGGWSGSTTVKAGVRLEISGASGNNQALSNTSAITLNGGTIALGSSATPIQAGTWNRINDGAVITSNGGTMEFNLNSSTTTTETVGTLNLVRGQFNLTHAFAISSGSYTFTFSGLSRTGATNTSAINLQHRNGVFSTGGTMRVVIGGVVANTAAGQIVGPWFTMSSANGFISTDYVVCSNGGSGSTYYAIPAAIGSSAQSTWTNAANQYTMSALASGTISGGTKNITALRSTNDSVTVTAGSADIALASHALAVNDMVTFSAGTIPTGLTAGTPYYVVATGAGTIRVSATKNGTAITPSTTGATVVASGAVQVSSGNNLGTTGILNGSATTLNIVQDGGVGVVTLPTTTADNLYINANSGAINIAAPIMNNTGALTLVKTGANTLTLSSTTSDYSGGTVLNAGTIAVTADSNLGNTSGGVTFNGTATLSGGVSYNASRAFTINDGAVANIAGAATVAGALTGSGTLVHADASVLTLSDASGFTGAITVGAASGSGTTTISAVSLSDASGAGTINVGNTTRGGVFSWAGNAGSTKTFTNRQFALSGTTGNGGIDANGFNPADNLVISQNLVVSGVGNKLFSLGGSNAGANTFSGNIADGTNGGASVIGVRKQGTGTWALAGTANTFSGTILLDSATTSAGTLSYASAGGANPITFNQTTSTATLKYTGAAALTMSGAITASLLTSGTITLDASGVTSADAINYSNTGSLGVVGSGNKNLILSGTNTGSNTLAGGWDNNTGGAATITKNGDSKWVLSGTNNYTGATVVNAGTLQFAKMVSLNNNVDTNWTAAKINVKSAATLALNVDSLGTNGFTAAKLDTLLTNISSGVTSAVLGLQGGSRIGLDTSTANGATFTQGNVIADSTGSGGFNGSIGLTKLGTGTLILDKTNTYTGATTVTAGTLIINGATSSTSVVTVDSGATLGGSGTIGGNTTISGIHSPGNSPGILTHGGNIIYEAGASVLWELVANSTASRGTNFDGINVGATIDFNGATTLNLNFNFGASAVEWQNAFWASSYTGTGGWLVYSGATSLEGFTFLGLNAPAQWLDESGDTLAAIRSDKTFGLYQDGNNIYLTYTVIPEPRAALLGGLGMLILLRRRRA